MFLIVLALFVNQFWNIHQLCVLQVLVEKREKTSRKEVKKWKLQLSLSRHSFCMSRHNFKHAKRTMSQPAVVCHNKVQDKLLEKMKSLLQQRVLCRDIAKE